MTKEEILNGVITEKKREALAEYFGEYRIPLGKTILKREIYAYKIGVGHRTALYVGAHHATEYITENLLYAMMYDVTQNPAYQLISGINRELLLQKFTFVVIPALNLDGIALHLGEGGCNILSARQARMSGGDFSHWQANARGVDLNHNYDAGFAEYKRLEGRLGILPGKSLFSGEYPESEPEARAIANLVRVTAPALVVSLHSQGEEIYVSPNTKEVLRLGEKLSHETGYKIAERMDTACYGGLCDYTGALGIPSFTVEVGRGENPLDISAAGGIYSAISHSLITLPTKL